MAVEKYRFYPYISAEEAFLGFMSDFKAFKNDNPNKVYLRSGPKDPVSGLRPREILGLIIMANVAMSESGDSWVPGWLVNKDGKPLPERVAHDGAIRCTSGPRKDVFMRFEQTMATEVASDASPEDIEAAILREINRKSSNDEDYVRGTALIILVDYIGQLSDLRKLAGSVSESAYRAIYLICVVSEQLKDFVCVILKSQSDTLGPISVRFGRPDGKPNVGRLYG